MELELSSAAQIILAILLGVAAVLRALTGFLPVWRARKIEPPVCPTGGFVPTRPMIIWLRRKDAKMDAGSRPA